MRAASVILSSLAVVLVFLTWFDRDDAGSGSDLTALFPRDIVITGRGNTLAAIARAVNDPSRFAYDPATRTATCSAPLVIEGELLLGRPDDPESGETLEMATRVCGDLRIEVRSGGHLQLHHSTIRTVSQILTGNVCSQGYALFVDGALTMDHGQIRYISGSTSQCLRVRATAVIRQSTFSYCDGSALSCINVDGRRITIADSEILGAGNWGLVVQGSGGDPLELRNCVLDGQVGAVFIAGGEAAVRLVDCVFDPSKIIFNSGSGKVETAWTRRIQVVDTSKAPLSGLQVSIREITSSGSGEIHEAPTAKDGIAEFTLTEWVARPGKQRESPEDVVKYRVAIRDPQGRDLVAPRELMARGKDQRPIIIRLP